MFMLKRILINLLLTILSAAALSTVVLLIGYYSSASFRADFELVDLFEVFGVAFGGLAILSFTALLLAVPKIGSNQFLSLLLYFFGCLAFLVSVLKDVHITSIWGIVLVWAPFVIFTLIHTFFYVRLIKAEKSMVRT